MQSAAVEQSTQPVYPEMIIDMNVSIPMRDGLHLKANVFRPKAEGDFAVIMSMGVYHKDMAFFQGSLGTQSKHLNFESLTPEDYVPHGYVLIRVDTRGSGQSPGFLRVFNTARESQDYYDAIEWAAVQRWSSGAVGLSGTSYLGMNQWATAALRPPHLKAIIPWEALTDHYRHSTYPGGVYREAFQHWYMDRLADHLLRYEARDGGANQNVGAENTMFLVMQHRLDDSFWRDHSSDTFSVDVPTLTASAWPTWGAVGHLRGSTEGFKEVASTHKRMIIYPVQFEQGTTISFYTKDGPREQLRWFDRFLKGIDNGVDKEPPVRIVIRRSLDPTDVTWRSEDEWPIARTQYTKFYLDAVDSGLHQVPPAKASEAKYQSGPLPALTAARPQEALAAFFGAGFDTTGVTFTTAPFEQETEITGELALYVKLASTLRDVDVHASVSIIHANGNEEVVTRGWLKASHRKLDPQRSTASMPYHTHDVEQYLSPGEPVDLAIDVWPTSMVFALGSRLKLRIVALRHRLLWRNAGCLDG